MSLLGTINRNAANRLADARRRYAELLEADDPKHAPELEKLMRELGKSPADAAADQKIIYRAIELERNVAAEPWRPRQAVLLPRRRWPSSETKRPGSRANVTRRSWS